MKINTITISEGQFLNQLEPFKSTGIPTDTILHKVITGCGATALEIKYTKRHSIIIVPNVPVIEDKVKEHNENHEADKQVLGVYDDVKDHHIEEYLNSKATYKKIITTPEGFQTKVLRVFVDDMDTLRNEYFLLFDECDRIISDVSYRDKIAAPFDVFFDFKNKALVSATTLPFSHIQLSKFNRYTIIPDYVYSKPINVIGTNSVIESLDTYLRTIKAESVFIFINSTNAIYDIIETLDIQSESKVYCGEKSVLNLKKKKFLKASHKLKLADVAKYNFLTSRYFSALDIILEYKPDVVMVTDVYTAEHSILDPHTEIIQIAGRFRKGINTLAHITNFNCDIEAKTKEESMAYLKGCFDTYGLIREMAVKEKNPGSKDMLQNFLNESFISTFYTSKMRVNQFKVDNYIHEDRVKGYYKSFNLLQAAYQEQEKQFTPTYSIEEYAIGDNDRIYRQSKVTIKEQQKETVRLIDRLTSHGDKFVILPSFKERNYLRSLYPEITEAYDLLGLQGLDRTKYKLIEIKKAVKRAQHIRDLKRLEPFVRDEFKADSEYLDSDIKEIMPKLCVRARVRTKATISLIGEFFKTERTTRSGVHIRILLHKLDLDALTPFD